jgi:hypothetical protein
MLYGSGRIGYGLSREEMRMSAPKEVWVTWILGGDGKPFAVDSNKAMRLDGDVRYLRADLVADLITAGEMLADAFDPNRDNISQKPYNSFAVAWDRALAALKEGKNERHAEKRRG